MGTRCGRRERRVCAAAALGAAAWLLVAVGGAWAQLPTTPRTLIPSVPVSPRFPVAPPPTVPSVVPPALVPPEGTEVRPLPTFELHPSITLSGEYTDNFFRRAGAEKEENFRTGLTPAATLLINGARTQGQITGGFTLAHDTLTEDTELIAAALGGLVSWQPTPRFSLTLSDFLRRSDDPRHADDLSLRRERESFTSNVFTATAAWVPGTVSTEAYYRLATFINDEGRLDDTVSHAIGAAAATALGPLTSASAGYEFLLSETDGSELTGHQLTAAVARRLNAFTSAGVSGSYAIRSRTGDNEADFSIWSTSLFANYTLPDRWSLSANIGFSYLDSDRQESRSTVTTQSTLSYLLARGSLYLTASQGFSETFASGEDFGVVETRGVTGGVSYRFTPFVHGRGQAFYRENTFTGVAGDLDGTEEVWGGGVGLLIRLRSWLSMVVDYSYSETSSGPRGEGFSENRVFLSLTAGY